MQETKTDRDDSPRPYPGTPARPRLHAALAAVLCWTERQARAVRSARHRLGHEGHRSGAAAWEALAARDLIPDDWATRPTRRFPVACEECRAPALTPCRSGCAHHRATPKGLEVLGGERRMGPAPALASEACLIAADAAGVSLAEGLAEEFMGRLAPWGVAPARHTLWLVGPRQKATVPTGATNSYLTPLLETMGRFVTIRRADIPASTAAVPLSHCVKGLEESWRLAAERGAKFGVPGRFGGAPGQVRLRRRQPVAEIANPWTPLLGLLGTGYHLVGITADTGVVVLSAPSDASWEASGKERWVGGADGNDTKETTR